MKTVILLLMTVSNLAMAEDWFCMHESGKREGRTIWACGIGESTDESSARQSAFKNAKKEFESICAMSSDCREKEVTVDPQRTSCEPYNGHWKCYRLLVISLKGDS